MNIKEITSNAMMSARLNFDKRFRKVPTSDETQSLLDMANLSKMGDMLDHKVNKARTAIHKEEERHEKRMEELNEDLESVIKQREGLATRLQGEVVMEVSTLPKE